MACNYCPRVQVTPAARRREAIGFLIAMALVILGAFVAVLTSGCKAGAGDPSDYAPIIRSGTALAVGQGWGALARKHPGSIGDLQTAARATADAVDGAIIPLLSGASTQEVTRAAVDQALAALDSKIPSELRPWVRTGIDLVLARVALPDNPTAKLDPTARALLLAFFQGVSQGTRDWLTGGGAATLATASVYGARAVAPPPRAWSGPLTWAKR